MKSLRKTAHVLAVVLVLMLAGGPFAGARQPVLSSDIERELSALGITPKLLGEISRRVRATAQYPERVPKEGFVLLGPSRVFEKMKAKEQKRQDALEAPRYQSAAASGLVPYRSPAPAFSRNLLVSRDFGTPIQTEPHVCANPEDRQNVVISVTDYGLPYNPMYVTFDGGEIWKGPRSVPLTDNTFYAGDPVLACGRGNKVHHVFMSIGARYYSIGNFPISLYRTDIAVSTSPDGGMNWLQPAITDTSVAQTKVLRAVDPETGEVLEALLLKLTFLDKPWIATGPDPKDPGRDNVYATFTEFADYYIVVQILGLPFFFPVAFTSQIIGVSSHDGGNTWVRKPVSPVSVGFLVDEESSSAQVQEIDYPHVQGSQPAVSKSGVVYATWYDTTKDGYGKGEFEIRVARSDDATKTWSKPVVAATLLEPYRQPRTAFFRNASVFPQMAIGPDGEVYIVMGARTEDKPADDGDIYFVRGTETDKVLAFTAPQRLNQDLTERLQFFPAIAVGEDGMIHVMWGDMRDDPAGLKYHIYYTQSTDKGENWGFVLNDTKEPDARVTDFPSNPNKGFRSGLFIGDYFGIAAGANGDAYLVWADTRLGEYGSTNQKIAFARKKAIPSPDLFLNPAKGPAGQKTTVQAFGFQPDMQVFVRIGGEITLLGKSDDTGKASREIFVPITSEGTHDVAVFDESGNTAVGSFWVGLGFGDLATEKGAQENTEKLVGLLNGVGEVAKSIFLAVLVGFGALLLIIAAVALVKGVQRLRRKRNAQ